MWSTTSLVDSKIFSFVLSVLCSFFFVPLAAADRSLLGMAVRARTEKDDIIRGGDSEIGAVSVGRLVSDRKRFEAASDIVAMWGQKNDQRKTETQNQFTRGHDKECKRWCEAVSESVCEGGGEREGGV